MLFDYNDRFSVAPNYNTRTFLEKHKCLVTAAYNNHFLRLFNFLIIPKFRLILIAYYELMFAKRASHLSVACTLYIIIVKGLLKCVLSCMYCFRFPALGPGQWPTSKRVSMQIETTYHAEMSAFFYFLIC